MKSSLDLVHLAATAAERAAEYIRGATGAGAAVKAIAKGHHDWATEVDRKAERLITEVRGRAAPGSRMIGEESSPALQRDGLVWVVDPLDGTTNFLHGYPQYAVSIAAAVNGILEAAVILDVNRELGYGAV